MYGESPSQTRPAARRCARRSVPVVPGRRPVPAVAGRRSGTAAPGCRRPHRTLTRLPGFRPAVRPPGFRPATHLAARGSPNRLAECGLPIQPAECGPPIRLAGCGSPARLSGCRSPIHLRGCRSTAELQRHGSHSFEPDPSRAPVSHKWGATSRRAWGAVFRPSAAWEAVHQPGDDQGEGPVQPAGHESLRQGWQHLGGVRRPRDRLQAGPPQIPPHPPSIRPHRSGPTAQPRVDALQHLRLQLRPGERRHDTRPGQRRQLGVRPLERVTHAGVLVRQ